MCLLVGVAIPGVVHAQATIGEPLEQGTVPGGRGDDSHPPDAGPDKGAPDGGIAAHADEAGQPQFGLIAQPPKVSEATILQAWQQRMDRLAAGDLKRVEAEEASLRSLREELGIENLYSPATAYIREADELITTGHPVEAVARCEQAVAIAPDFNLAHFCLARATLAKSPLAVSDAVGAAIKGYDTTMGDVRARRNAVTSFALTCFAGVAIACALLVLLLLARWGRLGLHDFHHLFPNAVPVWQSTLVAVVLLCLLPVLLGTGLLGALALTSLALALILRRSEAIALAIAFLLAAGAQAGGSLVVRSAAFGRVAQDVYLLERGDAPQAAANRIKARSDQGLGNFATAYALGHYHKRLGHYAEALVAYEAARKLSNSAELLNNIGNVQNLQGNTEDARKTYLAAIAANGRLAAPLWNIAKIYFKETKVEQGEQAFARARALDPVNATRVAGQGSTQDEIRANQLLVDVPLPNEDIERLAERESREMSAGGATWSLLSGHLSESGVVALAIITALLIVAAQFAQGRLHPSSRCDRCGLPVCVRCDPELTVSSGMCGQCITVFVRKTGVDPADRIRKEVEVRAYQRRRAIVSRITAVLVGGGGHVFTGHIIVGGLLLLVFSMLAAQVVFWHGVLQPPVPVFPTLTTLHVGLFAAAFLLILAGSLWHLSRVEEIS